MNIEIRGTGYGNKGAELMLLAILDRLGDTFPDARFVVAPGMGPYEWRATHGLYQKLDAAEAGRLGWLIEMLLHRGYRERYGLVTHEEIDVLLDASGFAYGDAWKPEWVEGGAQAIEDAKEAGQKVVLLPQAFGPFTKPRIREASRRIFQNADLIYARDPQSRGYVAELLDDEEVENKLRTAPDFTNLLPGQIPEEWQDVEGRVAVIPNTKMLEQGSGETAEQYVPFLCRCIREVEESGYRPFVLLHEAKQDGDLAEAIRERAAGPVETVYEPDPLRLKGIIGSCDFVISSRFHGLVNALSQGVPALATSWSHKYRHLMEEYGLGDFLSDVQGANEDLSARLQQMTDGQTRAGIAARLGSEAERLKADSKAMWKEVENVLKPDEST